MGLDQYAYKRKYDETVGDTVTTEIMYWRKHNRLHGYMEKLWRDRTGSSEDFNCKELELSLDDINTLEQFINNKELPETKGFFFGTDSYDCYADNTLQYQDYYSDKRFIQLAKEAIAEGYTIIYDSWW